MAFSVKFKFDDKEVTKMFNEITTELKLFKEPLTDSGDDLIEFFGEKNFDTQGAALGAPWKALSSSTLLARERRSGHYAKSPVATGKILLWTGSLSKGFQKKVTAFVLKIRNNVDYFKYNQPKRKMLDINKTVITIVLDAINKYLVKITKY